MKRQTFVIIGASLAGASAAAELRKRGFEGRIVLIGEEAERPYERPELSKKFLRGELETPKFVHPPGFYAEADVDLVTGTRAERIEVDHRAVITKHERFVYDRLLIATGAQPRRLSIPGSDLDGVVTLRTIEDAERIKSAAQSAASIVIVGGGWIGSEVAASLRQLGHNVTMILPTERPLEHVLGPEVGEVYRRIHQENGVALVTGTRVARFIGRDMVESTETEDGRAVAAELVVVGIGADPRIELAATAGIAVESGILVDERLESSVSGVFAAGDVASAWHPIYGRRIRIEHWDNAKRQGRTAAASMLGDTTPYERIPYFYSDQYDLGMEYTGFARAWERVVFRGAPASREFIAFWLHDGRVVAGLNANVWDVTAPISKLIQSGGRVDPDRLADLSVPLEDLVPAA